MIAIVLIAAGSVALDGLAAHAASELSCYIGAIAGCEGEEADDLSEAFRRLLVTNKRFLSHCQRHSLAGEIADQIKRPHGDNIRLRLCLAAGELGQDGRPARDAISAFRQYMKAGKQNLGRGGLQKTGQPIDEALSAVLNHIGE